MRRVYLLPLVLLSVLASRSLAEEVARNQTGPVYHVVAFKFRQDAKPQQIKNVEEAFAELKTKVPVVQSLHWGTNVSKEMRNKGFTHCWVLTFANEKDRDAYLVDPAHKAFGKLIGPVIADVFVLDFQSQP